MSKTIKPQFFLSLILVGALWFFFIRCTESSVGFYSDSPETLKRDKIAAFYGPQAKKNCEIYRRLYAGFCDTTSQPFITCNDLNNKKYKMSSCE